MTKPMSFVLVSLAALFSMYIVVNFVSFESQAASTDTVDLTLDVKEYLTFSITGGKVINFGDLHPGTPNCSTTVTVASVTTNDANGYTLGVHDGSATDSPLTKGGGVYIKDYAAGTIDAPAAWTGFGLGLGLFDADSAKEAKWGTGTTVCDPLNTYAAVPETATTAHTVTGYIPTTDTSSWSWQVDVPNDQPTGVYTGTVTFTATGVLT